MTRKLKLLFGLMSMIIFPSAQAAEFTTIQTPRGSNMEVSIEIPQSTATAIAPLATLLIAPGQNCNAKSALFDTLSLGALSASIAVVRFEWSYCTTDPMKPFPSKDFKNEIEDFQSALKFAQQNTAINKDKMFFAGKSLGSVIAFKEFKKNPLAAGLFLLTPICSYRTDAQGSLLKAPQDVTNENYPDLKSIQKPVMIVLGNSDEYCSTNIILNYIRNSPISILIAGGDHGLRLKDSIGLLDPLKTQKNFETVTLSVTNWIYFTQ